MNLNSAKIHKESVFQILQRSNVLNLPILLFLFVNMNKKQRRKRLISQQQFTVSSPLYQKPRTYQPLEDPHTKYFFFNQSTQTRLRHLSKAIKREVKSTDNFRMRSLITQKLHPKRKTFYHPKTNVYQMDIIGASKQYSDHFASMTLTAGLTVKQLISSHLKIGKKKMINSITAPIPTNQTMISQPIESSTLVKNRLFSKKDNDKMQKHHRYANKLFQQLHQKKRNKWKKYLSEKMEALSKEQSKQKQSGLQQKS